MNSEMIWTTWKKGKLKCEIIWKIGKKDKLNSEFEKYRRKVSWIV
jgi:hypothetical protein